MRLGAYVFNYDKTAKGYVEKLVAKNYRAAYLPDYIKSPLQEREIMELREELAENDILLSEVGAWCNPLSPDADEAGKAKLNITEKLKIADMLGANCCVNIIGSASADFWYAPDAKNFTEEFRTSAAGIYQEIIDKAQPRYTKLAFEVMPYCFLDCTKEYLDFLKRIDRPEQTAVHLDLVNFVHDSRTLFQHRELFSEAVKELGSRCVSAHLKDIDIEMMPPNTRLNEVPVGTGRIDIGHMMRCLAEIEGDLPVMLEHLPDEASYDRATKNIVKITAEAGIKLKGGF